MSISLSGDWFVNPQVLGGFYEKFKDRSRDEIQRFSYNQGLALGQKLVAEMGIKGNDEEAIAAVLRELLKDEPTVKILRVREGKILLRNAGFCPLMTACLSLNLPWAWLCEVLGWPWIRGVASAVNPKVDLSIIKQRMNGDPHCDHLFEIGEGRLILP